MSATDLGPTLTSIFFFAIPMVWIVAHYCHLTLKSWSETALKRDMVARGYTANEIIDVIDGTRTSHDSLSNVPPAKPVRQPV